MTRVSSHSFAALQQDRAIEGRVCGEAGFHRQRPHRCAGVVEPCALDESKARVPGGQAAEQSDKSRTKQRDANRCPFRKGPAPEDVAPQKRQNEKVAPDHELEVVPFPWRGFEKITYAED